MPCHRQAAALPALISHSHTDLSQRTPCVSYCTRHVVVIGHWSSLDLSASQTRRLQVREMTPQDKTYCERSA